MSCTCLYHMPRKELLARCDECTINRQQAIDDYVEYGSDSAKIKKVLDMIIKADKWDGK